MCHEAEFWFSASGAPGTPDANFTLADVTHPSISYISFPLHYMVSLIALTIVTA